MSYPPFILVPQQANPYYYQPQSTPYAQQTPRPQQVQTPAPISAATSSGTSSSASTGKSVQAAPFKAPAHKHAHHLHTIPPREKSTRTLIIDHLLWVHCRTRFAQARAELGMTDRTGGSSSPNYIHRERPENYEEEDEADSEGEDVGVLTTRSLWMKDTEEERLAVQDLQLAKSLRTRSESVEKVINSMLNQPPPLHPLHPDDLLDPSNPSKQPAHGTNSHPHALPNGVRLRLALATLINDFFARQAFPVTSQTSITYLPSGIVPLIPISASILTPENHPLHPAHYSHLSRTRSFYTSGVDLSSAPTSRCSRHLSTACTVCNTPTIKAPPSGKRTSSFRAHDGGITGWKEGSGIGSGLSKPGLHENLFRRNQRDSTNMVELLIRFLRLSALVAMELGSEAVEGLSSADGNGSEQQHSSASPNRGRSAIPGRSTPTSPGVSRISRDMQKQSERESIQTYALRPSKEWYMLCAGLITRTVLEGYMTYGWTGLCALETLMKIGLGLGSNSDSGPTDREGSSDADEDPLAQFDPDDFPSLVESAKVLFPSLRHGIPHSKPTLKEGSEAEYELEMEQLLVRFYDIPATALDLTTHLEDLSWQHPTEPLERAALRFFEAIAKWRGKPELETYKKKPNNRNTSMSVSADDIDMAGPLSIESLVNSSPIVQTMGIPSGGGVKRPGIERYFVPPSSGGDVSLGMLGFGNGGPKRRGESIVYDTAKRTRNNQADVQ